MNWKSMTVLLISVLIFSFSMVACEKEGGAEKAGKKIDKAFETLKEKVDDATK